jgi:hypothetical protein
MQAITSSNFNAKIADVVRSVKSQRDNVQALLMFAVAYAAENNGNFLYATTLVNKLTSAKGMAVATLVSYIKAHCAVVYGKDKAGNLVFKPLAESKREGRPLVNFAAMNAAPWYEHGKAKAEPTVKTMEQLISYLEKWAGADADKIDADACAMAKVLVARATMFKNECILREVAKAA